MAFKRYFRRTSVRKRYLFSFLLVALIPIGIILVSFYHFNVEELRLDVEDINIKRISQIQLDFENEITKHYSLAGAIYQDQKLIPLMKQERLSKNYEALLILRQYLSYRDMDLNTGIYLMEKDQVYSKTGIMTHDVYFQSMLQLDYFQIDKMLNAIANKAPADSNVMLSVKQKCGSQILLCAYTLPIYNANPSAILLTVIDYGQILDMFSPIFNDLNGTAFILNSRQDMIFHTVMNDGLEGHFQDAILSIDYTNKSPIIHPIVIGNKNHSFIYSSSEETGILYGVLAEESMYLTKVRKQTTLVWQTIVVALSICIIIAFLLTSMSYRPLKELLKLIKTDAKKNTRFDEYAQIRTSIMNDTTRLDKLEMILDLQRPYILERFLGYALYSSLTPVEIRQLFQLIDIHFEHPLFFVVCVKALRNNSSKPGYSFFKTAIIDTVSTMNDIECKYYTLERSDEDEIIVIVNCQESIKQQSCSIELQRKLIETIGTQYLFTMGVGSISHVVEDLKTSLYEASILVQTQIDKPITFLEDIDNVSEDYLCIYPAKEIILFQLQLKQGDETNAKRSLTQLYEIAEDSTHSYLMSRYIYTFIATSIMEVVQQVKYNPLKTALHELIMFKSIEMFKEASVNLVEDLCKYINDNKQSKNTLIRDQILAFIKNNLTDFNLSLESIGQEFNLSPYYVSRFFRDQNNINLKDYITELKIAKAKELLVTTNWSVSDIVNKIGYISVSSFIRKFKLIEGFTPGEYRIEFTEKQNPV